jgi:hypothetical protein
MHFVQGGDNDHDDGGRRGIRRHSRQTSARRRPLPSQWQIASSTSSLCGTASPSSFASRF